MHRHRSISTYVGAVTFALALYFGALGVMAACIHLGWYAHPEPQPVATASVTTMGSHGEILHGAIDVLGVTPSEALGLS